MGNVQLSHKPTFFYNATNGAVWQGLFEWQDAPYGWRKIVCTSAHEAEIWSDRMRQWDRSMHEMTLEQRELVEGPIREEMRSELRHQMANSRNNVNRDFLARALETLNGQGNRLSYRRESYMHAEAYERGR